MREKCSTLNELDKMTQMRITVELRDMETVRYGDYEIWRLRDVETMKHERTSKREKYCNGRRPPRGPADVIFGIC